MRRLALIVLVGLLAANLAGGFSLIVPEPCGTDEPAGTTHTSCPPTCAQCGCCRQPAVAALPVVVVYGVLESGDLPTHEGRIVCADPAEILHVPKASPA